LDGRRKTEDEYSASFVFRLSSNADSLVRIISA
jgi:hypothetical protein